MRTIGRGWRVAFLLSALSGSLACGGGNGGGGGLGDADVDVDGDVDSIAGFWDAYLNAACEVTLRCESKSPASLLFEFLLCHPRVFTDLMEPNMRQLEAAIASGRLVYDEERARQCLDAIRSAPDCDPYGYWTAEVEEACANLVRGTVPRGGDCTMSAECTGGNRCLLDGACPGTCVERLGEGEPCTETEECAEGLTCGVDDTCTPREVDGCETPNDCAEGLTCVMGTCETLPGRGEDCERTFGYSWCEGNLVCVGEEGSAICAVGAAIGEACGETQPCAVGTRCAGDVCVHLSRPGGACDDDVNCPGGYSCEAGECVALPTIGEACGADRPCVQGACLDGLCMYLSDGEPCDTDGSFSLFFEECVGYCDHDLAEEGGICAPAGSEGDACEADKECVRGLECQDDGIAEPGVCEPICVL